MKKRITFIIAAIAAVCASTVMLTGCIGNRNYFKNVAKYSFWDNKSEQAVAQYNIYNIMNDHLTNGVTYRDGKAYGVDGKVKKVALIGFDGARADGLINLIKDDNSDTNGCNESSPISGVNKLDSTGGVYLAYCGGEKGKDSQQATSTAPGWASMLTGGWNTEHGVKNNKTDKNDYQKNMEYKTIMLKYSETYGLKTLFTAQWGEHFTNTYVKEVQYLSENPSIPMEYMRAESYTGIAVRDIMIDRINNDYDIVFGILEATDDCGHGIGFGQGEQSYINAYRTNDLYAYQIIDAIESRPEYDGEDWLIIMSTDHGGIKRKHGGQTLEERIIWIACNKPIDEKYYSANFDGYKLK